VELDIDNFNRWLDAYGAAWQDGDAEAAMALFAMDAEYYENPFDDPMVGKDAIHRYWSDGAGESQRDVRFVHEAIAVVESTGLAHWQAAFVRIPSGNHVELDGFLMAEFDASGRCAVFREWWHRREEGAIEAA
jgi:ketosteroid isomerase-like protein